MTTTPTRRYRTLSSHLRERFGVRVRSVTIDAGFTCPNVDGTVTTGGCVYCDNRSFSPNRRLPRATVSAQVERGITILPIVMGQNASSPTSRPAPIPTLPSRKSADYMTRRSSHPQIIGLAIGTRPDSVPDEVLDLLQEYARSRLRVARVGDANDSRSLAGLDESRTSLRRLPRRRRSLPRSWPGVVRSRHSRFTGGEPRRHAGDCRRAGTAADAVDQDPQSLRGEGHASGANVSRGRGGDHGASGICAADLRLSGAVTGRARDPSPERRSAARLFGRAAMVPG